MKVLVVYGTRPALVYQMRDAVVGGEWESRHSTQEIRRGADGVWFATVASPADLNRLNGFRFDVVLFDDSFYRYVQDIDVVIDFFKARASR